LSVALALLPNQQSPAVALVAVGGGDEDADPGACGQVRGAERGG
jgi:hypothetical protein